MELLDGFIVGVYNWCDRWCETCALTSRCRVFADRLETEAEPGPNLKGIANAPPLPEATRAPQPRRVHEFIDEANDAAREPLSAEAIERLEPTIPHEHQVIDDRMRGYSERTTNWLLARGRCDVSDPADARAVIGWFSAYLRAKLHRAFRGLAQWNAEDDQENEFTDHNGTAKAVLLGFDRSHAAWVQLVNQELAPMREVAPFVAELIRLRDEVEAIFPKARSFVRPGLDEPEAVANLEA